MNHSSDQDLKVAILGLGIMGKALARNLDEDGFLVSTWNRTPKKDMPYYLEDVSEVVRKANILLIVVTDGHAVTTVLDKIEPYLTENHIVVQCATVKPDENIKFNKRIKESGAGFIETLLGGSEVAVLNRKLPVYMGGDKVTVKKVEVALDKFASKCIHVGAVGTASVAKLAMNLNLAIQLEALCESYAYATSNGLTDDQYFNVLRNNTGWNFLAEYKEPKLRNRDFAPQFSVRNMLKDVRLALDTDKTDNGMALLNKTESIYSNAENAGFGDEDMISLLKMILNK